MVNLLGARAPLAKSSTPPFDKAQKTMQTVAFKPPLLASERLCALYASITQYNFALALHCHFSNDPI